MEYLWISLIVVLGYLAYILYIKPLRLKAYYSKTLKAQGYKVFQFPYQLLSAPFMVDWFKNQVQKKDAGYSGKYIYSDSYDVLITNIFNNIEIIFFNEKLLKGFFDKDLQWNVQKFCLGYEITTFMAQKSVVFIEKNAWKHRRGILQKVFNFDFISSQIPTMVQSANEMFQNFEQQYWAANPQKRSQRQIEIDVYSLLSKYTSDIIMVGFLGSGLKKEQLRGKKIQEQILNLAYQSIQLSRHPLHMILGTKLMKLGLGKAERQFLAFNKETTDFLKTFIQKQRQLLKAKDQKERKQPKNIVQLILQNIQKEKIASQQRPEITDEDLIDQIKAFLIAGTDTTSNYLTMLIFFIYQHKEVLQRLRNQINEHIKSDQDITYQNIKKIAYLDIVMMESTRMMSASEGGFERVITQDTVICEIPMKKGTCLNFYTKPTYYNPKVFTDPFSFKPQRWQVKNQETKRLQQLLSYQFYGGPRGCLGKHLALTQSKIGVIKFLKHYKNLYEHGINDRSFRFQISTRIGDSNATLERYS